MTNLLQCPHTTGAIYLSVNPILLDTSYHPKRITFFTGMLNFKLTHQKIADRNILDRVVSHIYTVYDPRPKGQRPLAADIFLSFWYHELGIPIESLHTIFLEKVQEDTMREAREHVYGLRRKELSERLIIRRGGNLHGEIEAFELTYHTTKFGRCARTMETQNLVTREFGIRVSHFEFDPRTEDASSYNVLIEFAVDQGHHRPHGGHWGHH